MRDFIEEICNGVAAPFYFGQILVTRREGAGFVLLHREDASLDQLQTYQDAEDAIEIAKYDDAGNYRPLKTAPNLRHGWRLELDTIEELRIALDYFYPSRLAVFAAWKSGNLKMTALRETLDRQSGMYRVAAKISDLQINDLVANFCRSDRDASEPFCGNAIGMVQSRRRNCRRRSLILFGTRRRRGLCR
jgi:sirohydrochlorin cobaltochelatase